MLTDLLDRLLTLDPAACQDPTLATGAAGVALALHTAADLDPRCAEPAQAFAARAVELLGEVELGASLFHGLAGVGWVAQRVGGDIGDALDEALLDWLDGEGPETSLDLIGGLSGVAVYAAERAPAPGAMVLLGGLAERVAARALHTPRGLLWALDPAFNALPRERPLPSWNLGVAHGAPGPISVLALATAYGVADYGALIDEALDTLRRLDATPFPSAVGPADTLEGRARAWCYGGFGVGAWLRALAKLSGRELGAWGEELVARHFALPSDTRDPFVCHGDAGAALILSRDTLYRDPNAEAPVELLEGVVGMTTTLAELAGASGAWKRCLLLDFRTTYW